MIRKTVLVLVAALSGLIGGTAATWLSNPRPAAAAEEKPRVPEVIEARRLVVRDQEGRERVTLGTKPDGSAGVSVLDNDGTVRASLELLPDGLARLLLCDKTHRALMVVGTREEGKPLILCTDSQAKPRLLLGLEKDGAPSIRMDGRERRVIWSEPTASSQPFEHQDEPDYMQVQAIPDGKAAWRRLQVGMSQDEVRSILGEPGKINVSPPVTLWLYPDALGGNVVFDEKGKVQGWNEP